MNVAVDPLDNKHFLLRLMALQDSMSSLDTVFSKWHKHFKQYNRNSTLSMFQTNMRLMEQQFLIKMEICFLQIQEEGSGKILLKNGKWTKLFTLKR